MKNITKLKSKIRRILKKNGVIKASLFGSYARGEQKKKSDIDILIEVKRKKFSLLDHSGLKIELEEKLGKKVDLLTYKSINPYIKKYILADEVRII